MLFSPGSVAYQAKFASSASHPMQSRKDSHFCAVADARSEATFTCCQRCDLDPTKIKSTLDDPYFNSCVTACTDDLCSLLPCDAGNAIFVSVQGLDTFAWVLDAPHHDIRV
jgi:hypothetical protein